jgi:3-mercaptopropionate dioxygenase
MFSAPLRDNKAEQGNRFSKKVFSKSVLKSARVPFTLGTMKGDFFVEHPLVRSFVANVTAIWIAPATIPQKLARLKNPFNALLQDQEWLPSSFRQANATSAMGGGIGSWLIYRSLDPLLSFFSLVVPSGVATPVHNHLAWGLVGLYQGEQLEEEFEPASEQSPWRLRIRRVLRQGDFYELVPPHNDIHRVRTTSELPSVSLHLLANDTGCVMRAKFDAVNGETEPFRSGWSNAPCEEEDRR